MGNILGGDEAETQIAHEQTICAPRKQLRILCLHGMFQTGGMMRKSLEPVQDHFG
eukprot:CAMPEP_0197684748 /NCGR_PEP_ID=MMETSP1338-20131121/99906_1 /TAXON_ID=43686 ORGANISM="Pelagodinium beii, Strain RCC1491" /NCGR_SAMPLE_ID=MMETSP1338 /ASSEMBLY_ACC=CAM_ASM_000754 /LENGTH=54 /DNA_ID=CAMNT_0043266497 /DNA_START=24 /DNA_END=184 /DNA_ORIENTATION=-